MICKHPGNPLLHKGIVGMRFLFFWGKFVSLAADKVKYESVHQGDERKAPLSRPQTRNPLQ